MSPSSRSESDNSSSSNFKSLSSSSSISLLYNKKRACALFVSRTWLGLQDMNNAPSSLRDRALGEPGSNPASTKASKENKKSPYGSFLFSLWLGLQDSNLRMTGPKPVALPLGDSLTLLNYITKPYKNQYTHPKTVLHPPQKSSKQGTHIDEKP